MENNNLEMTGIEEIVEVVKKRFLNLFEEMDKEGFKSEHIEPVLNIVKLSNKILTYDYFSKSENIFNSDDFNNSKSFNKKYRKWQRMYNKELKEKRHDLKQLFRKIIKYSEEL